MTRQLAPVILSSGFAMLACACATKSFVQEQVSATKSFVQEQVSATETKLSKRADIQETKLRDRSHRATTGRQAITLAADQRLDSLDMRGGEVSMLASDAKARADSAAAAAHDAEARLSQRLADRNKYRVVETRFIYFDSDRADIRNEGISELEDVAKALREDPNAVLELQGFADPRGSDRYNYELTSDRVEAVIRHLVQRHNIELRQMRAVAMGKVALVAGQKASPEAFAKTRRVDIRLLTPWSSWEDAQIETDQTAPKQRAAAVVPGPLESAQPIRAATIVPPAHSETAATSIAPDQPTTPKMTDVPPREPTAPSVTVKTVVDAAAAASTAGSPRPGRDGDEFRRDAAEKRLAEFLKSVSPRDLGGKE
jgi:outer membrane protein OmpA-like peptidoglycan-associated protein